MSKPRLLTLYFTKNERTFNPLYFKAVLYQRDVEQDVYVVSAEPVNLAKYGFSVPNIVIPTKDSWPVPIRVAYSFNAALIVLKKRYSVKLENYDYLFKVDSDVLLPLDYAANVASKGFPVGGFGAALLISTRFFETVLSGRYPISYCDDGHVIAAAIATYGGIGRYTGKGEIAVPVLMFKDREYIYGAEYYKWGASPLLLLIFPLTRLYLIATKKMKRYQEKKMMAFLYNVVGYLHAWVNREKKYWFHRRYNRMKTLQLFREFAEGVGWSRFRRKSQ